VRMVEFDAFFWQVSRTGAAGWLFNDRHTFLAKETLCDQHFPQPFGVRIGSREDGPLGGLFRVVPDSFVKGLILAQNERWRRGLGMQVERVRRKADQWRKGE
jgi:hypothetical protein